jgi:hypothetical protein
VLCVHRVTASDPAIDPASPASPSSESVVAPTEPPWSPPPCTYSATCSPCISPAVEPQPPTTVASATPVSILDDPDKDVTWQVNHLTREALRIIRHQRLGRMHSRRVSDMHKYAIGVFNLPIKTEINDCPIGLMAKLLKANKSTSSTRKATQYQQGVSIDSALLCNPP